MSKSGPASLRRRGCGRRTIELAQAALEVFAGFDGSMSTRQVYYQLVSRGVIQNKSSEYERVQRLLVEMRRDGRVSYHRVVDRTRGKHQRPGWAGVEQLMDAASDQYRRDLWLDQSTVVMVACEKQALEGIFAEACDEYGASLWTLRGYSSESFAFEWATEIRRVTRSGSDVVVAYFGDFDPSGLGIEQDSKDKLTRHGASATWFRHGLVVDDFDLFDLVNVPVKRSDSRAKSYLDKYGDRAAELDALPPDELRNRIREAIEEHIDVDTWERVRATEMTERESLQMVTRNWDRAVQAVAP
jgi:hypothetical protein